jgi:hypothetical protein
MSNVAKTICSFSLQFPPLAGVDFVQLVDGTLEFRLRVENTTNYKSTTTTMADQVIVSESQLDVILRLMEAHRRAHVP